MMPRILFVLSAIVLTTACDNSVTEELSEVPPAMTDGDGTWNDARREMSDVIDEIGDTVDPGRRAEIELELDRQLQEIDDVLANMEEDIENSDWEIRMDGLEQAADKARRDLAKIPDAAGDAWKDASHEVATAIEDLDMKVKKLKVEVENK
ncbi:MAG: hypothetical protein EP330_23905 [Deltaproteobacteria bacterium]|nr:MAG: hypothetical protein EP330_23905 [Deltaproteobacteria bacterium]